MHTGTLTRNGRTITAFVAASQWEIITFAVAVAEENDRLDTFTVNRYGMTELEFSHTFSAADVNYGEGSK